MSRLFSVVMTLFLPYFLFGQNINISEDVIFDGEPYIAVNPQNSEEIAVAWMGFEFGNQFQIHLRTSLDGGSTWSNELLIPHVDPSFSSADPCLHFDSSNHLFLSYIDWSSEDELGSVMLRQSNDLGSTWSEPVPVINFDSDEDKKPIDRPWMVIDNSGGENDGTIYISTMNLAFETTVLPPYKAYYTTITDNGENVQNWQYLDAENFEIGNLLVSPMPAPAMSPNGTLHIAYPAWVLADNLSPRYILASSTDGGQTFTRQTMFYVEGNPDVDSDNAKKGYKLLADPSDSNHLVFISPGGSNNDLDIVLMETFDSGGTWTDPIRVNDDPLNNDRMQDMVWADFASNGDLIVIWRDRRNGTNGTYATDSEIYAAFRPSGQSGFEPNFTITDQLIPYDEILTSAGNDFLCVHLEGDVISSVWGDTRDGVIKIWFQRMNTQGEIIAISEIKSENLLSIYPNPATATITVDDFSFDRYVIYNSVGQLVMSKENLTTSRTISIEHLAPGTYFLECFQNELLGSGMFMKN